jgi:hypothetical protein
VPFRAGKGNPMIKASVDLSMSGLRNSEQFEVVWFIIRAVIEAS